METAASAETAAAQAEPRPAVQSPCANCGETLPGRFCSSCGQRNADPRASVPRLAAELLDDHLSLNSKLPRTLGAIFFRPGYVTEEYFRGRIVRYIRPVRLYLLASLGFFLLLTVLGMMAYNAGAARLNVLPTTLDALADSIAADPEMQANPARRDSVLANLEQARRNVVVTLPDDLQSVQFQTGWTALDTRVQQRIRELSSLPREQLFRVLLRDFLNRAPVLVFLLLPVFALILKLLYFRSNRFYVEHLVFALHLHAFWFFAFVLLLLFRYPLVSGVVTIWIGIYVFLAMKRFYRQGVPKTVLKYFILGSVYPMILMLGLMLTLLTSLALA